MLFLLFYQSKCCHLYAASLIFLLHTVHFVCMSLPCVSECLQAYFWVYLYVCFALASHRVAVWIASTQTHTPSWRHLALIGEQISEPLGCLCQSVHPILEKHLHWPKWFIITHARTPDFHEQLLVIVMYCSMCFSLHVNTSLPLSEMYLWSQLSELLNL